MIGFETSDLKKRRKVDFYNHVAARHHTGVHDVGFGATVKSQFYVCAYVFFGTFFTSGHRSKGRRSDLLRVPSHAQNYSSISMVKSMYPIKPPPS